MSWRVTITTQWADILRFVARGLLLLNGIFAALAATYVGAKFLWFFVRYLDRTLFSAPW